MSKNSVDVAKATQVAFAGSGSTDVRKVNPVGVSYKDIFNLSAPINENPHLTPNFTPDSGQMTRKFRADDAVRGDPALISALKKALLAGF